MTEHSYGIIPLIKRGEDWHVLLVQLHSGNHWSFPKGHRNRNESPWKTAERELNEETGLKVRRLLSETILHESYFVGNVPKEVDYFLAEVEGDVIIQPEEIAAFQWINLLQAEEKLTYEQSKAIARKAVALLLIS